MPTDGSLRKWTPEEAIRRVSNAGTGSLDPDRVTPEYLETLKDELFGWIESIDGLLNVLKRQEKT